MWLFYPLIVWKTLIFPKHYLLPPSVEAGPNPSDGRGALCQAALNSSVVAAEPKQQRPGNINTVSFSVEQKRAENASNTLCMHACVCLSNWRGKISTLHRTKRCEQRFSIAQQGALLQGLPGVTAASDGCKREVTSGSDQFLSGVT